MIKIKKYEELEMPSLTLMDVSRNTIRVSQLKISA